MPRYMLMHNMKPVFKHDCDHCEFLGTIEIEHNAMIVDLYACLHERREGPQGSIIARYGNAPDQNISHCVHRGMIRTTSIWAQVAAVFSDLTVDASGVDYRELMPGVPVRYNDMRITHCPVDVLTDSPLFRELIGAPKAGDPVYTNPGAPRTVTEVIKPLWTKNDGRRIYHLRDSSKREFYGAKIIHDGNACWATV